jgi:serine/threonine protein kinase
MPIATGTLKDYQFTNVEHRKFIFYQIFNGLNYIHSKQVWHLDIKPDNILIFEEYKNSTGYVTLAKITDFGISLFRPVVGKSHTNVATLYWKAPELLLHDDYYTETVDIWGMGVMLLEQILGINIMISISETDLLFRIFRLLGTPNKNSWKGITSYRKWKSNYPVYERSLEKIFNIEFESDEIKKEIDEIIDFEDSEKKDSSSKSFNEELIDNSNHIKINISEDEYEILFHTLTWPTKRYTADKILKLHYWNSIKDEINIRIPTKPLNESYMIKEQKQITVKKWHKSQSRKIYYNLLWRMGTYLKIEKKAIFYTYYLLDLLGEKTTIEKETRITYCVTMLKIVNDFLTNDYVGADGYINAFQYITKTNNISFIEKDLEYEVILETQYKILTLLDFKLCYPISVDFIDKYVKYDNIDITRETYPKKDIVKDLKIEKVKYDAILYYLYSLTLNYRYAILYTQEQLAQLAIRAADVNIPELENIPNLYTDEIREYLLEV